MPMPTRAAFTEIARSSHESTSVPSRSKISSRTPANRCALSVVATLIFPISSFKLYPTATLLCGSSFAFTKIVSATFLDAPCRAATMKRFDPGPGRTRGAMAEIFPFSALRYDAARVKLDDVLTQPYDKIPDEMQERYYARSPYNLIPVEKGRSLPDDGPGNSVYTRAAETLKAWIAEGILVREPSPAIYVY